MARVPGGRKKRMSRGRVVGLGMILLALLVTGCAAP
jgi:hypothetical protein